MISVLPPHHAFGQLEVIETYVYFDGPKLFAVKNAAGQIFLCIWIEDTDKDDSYIFVPVTRARFVAVRSGALNLRTAFTQPELGFVFNYVVTRLNDGVAVTPLLAEQVDDGLFPDIDQFLRYPTETMPLRFADLDLKERAHSFRREVVGLHLDFKNSTREEAPTGGLGKVLIGIQESLDALGQLIEGEPTLAGVIAPGILTSTQTQVVSAGGGSFALEIAAQNSVDLFNNSLITDSLLKLIELLAVGSSYSELRRLLTEVKPRAASKYKKLLAALVSSQTSLSLDWASPNPANDTHIEMSFDTARTALRTAEQLTREIGETRKIEGYFDGIEIPRRTFLAISDADNTEYRGKILQSALGAAEHITIKERYLITIKETIETTITGDERPRYELEAIEPLP